MGNRLWEGKYRFQFEAPNSKTIHLTAPRPLLPILEFEKVVLIIIVPLFNHWLQTWEAIKEDSDGLLEVSVQEMIQRARRKRMIEKSGAKIKLGMMRHMFIVLDMSECMRLQVRYRVNKLPVFDRNGKFHLNIQKTWKIISQYNFLPLW